MQDDRDDAGDDGARKGGSVNGDQVNKGEDQGNPFDPRKLRISQRFGEGVDSRKALITVPVRKPGRQEFVRVHPNPNWRLETAVLEFKEEREVFLVEPSLWPEIPGECVPKTLYTTISRQGIVALWPVRLPDESGRLDEWNRSAHEIAQRGMQAWIRVAANMGLGAYEVFEALAKLPEPAWPDVGFDKLLEIAFRGRYIDSLDHPVLRRLRGEF